MGCDGMVVFSLRGDFSQRSPDRQMDEMMRGKRIFFLGAGTVTQIPAS